MTRCERISNFCENCWSHTLKWRGFSRVSKRIKTTKNTGYGITTHPVWKKNIRAKALQGDDIRPTLVIYTDQTYTPTVTLKHEPKSWRPHRRQVVHPRPQTLQGESVVKPETLLLIIPSLLYYSDINEGYRKVSNPLFEKIVLGQKHQREVEKAETVSQKLIVSILMYYQHLVKDNQCPERAGRHPFPRQLDI